MALSSALSSTHPIYRPVDATNREFRLLRILSGDASSPVQYLLTKECLPDAPAFTALSYTWGEPDPSCQIEVNSKFLRVTKNLLRFLLQVRQLLSYADHYFWIDAVCVDQSDIKERGEQVSLMSSIYSSADVVILWLGPAYGNSDLAMRALEGAGSTRQAPNTQFAKLWRNSAGAAIRQLCERRYWTRLWVLQELALANDRICIVCGAKRLRWADFTSFILRLRPPLFRNRSETDFAYDGLMKSPGRAMSIQVAKSSAESLLYDQVLAAQHLSCLDPRDKVYGVLGLAQGTPLGPIRVDYDISLVQVAHQVIQRDLAIRPATSLDDVRERTQRLADALAVSVGDILSTRELFPASVTAYPLLHGQTGIDLLWVGKLHLWDVVKLWLSGRGIHQITAALGTAVARKATAAKEAILGVWQDFSSAVNSPDTTQLYAARCELTIAFTFKMGSASTCLDCKDLYAHRPDASVLPILYKAILYGNIGVTLMLLVMNTSSL